MTIGKLTAIVDTWTVQAVMASGWLTRLYRSLGDDRQAALAIQVGITGLERLKRKGLQPGRQELLEAASCTRFEPGKRFCRQGQERRVAMSRLDRTCRAYRHSSTTDNMPPPTAPQFIPSQALAPLTLTSSQS